MRDRVWLVKECNPNADLYVPYYAGTPGNDHGTGWVCREYALRYASRSQARQVAASYNERHKWDPQKHPRVRVVALRLGEVHQTLTAGVPRDLTDVEIAAMTTASRVRDEEYLSILSRSSPVEGALSPEKAAEAEPARVEVLSGAGELLGDGDG